MKENSGRAALKGFVKLKFEEKSNNTSNFRKEKFYTMYLSRIEQLSANIRI